MKFSLAFSPCPNDTFIFDAIVNKKIDTAGIEFDVVLEDVQTLNQWAIDGRLDITKISYGVLPLVLDKYIVLNSGSALGKGVGPLLITRRLKEELREEYFFDKSEVENASIAIPGENTTAHLLFSLAYPNAKKKVFLRYDKIEDFVVENKGLGVIIHENRFTYEEKGLKKIADLGDFWEQQTGSSIPLGGIVIKRDIDIAIQRKVDDLIKKSIEFAFSRYPELNDYIRKHSQEMSEAVMRKHIDLYVNNYSIDLGNKGKDAIEKLLSVYKQVNPAITFTENIFLPKANP